MSEPVISPYMPDDDTDRDTYCARCGGEMAWIECDTCGGEGGECDEDYPDEYVECGNCDGYGGWNVCANSPRFCEDSPLPGRENRIRGEIEWREVIE